MGRHRPCSPHRPMSNATVDNSVTNLPAPEVREDVVQDIGGPPWGSRRNAESMRCSSWLRAAVRGTCQHRSVMSVG
jgi:hypothetical protein